MRISASDVSTLLKQRLDPLYLILGEESLLKNDARKMICHEATRQGYIENERFHIENANQLQTLLAQTQNLNLFSEKRIMDCRILESKLDKMEIEILLKIAGQPDPNTILILCFENLDRKHWDSPWMQTLERQAIKILANPLKSEAKMAWLKKKMQASSLNLSDETLNLILERNEGNLWATEQALQKLKLCAPASTSNAAPLNLCKPENAEFVALIGQNSRYSLFELVEAALAGLMQKTIRIFSSLRQEGSEPVLMLWAFTQEVRKIIPLAYALKSGRTLDRVFQEQGVWQHKKPIYAAFLDRVQICFLQDLLLKASEIDALIKGRPSAMPTHLANSIVNHRHVPNHAYDALFTLYLTLAGNTALSGSGVER